MTQDRAISTSKISFNLPAYMESLPPLKSQSLSPTELKLYLRLSLEFQVVLDECPSFQMGAYKWNQILPERLQKYGLTADVWEYIATIGDNCDEIQAQLQDLLTKYELR